mgnify:CR=1 FL=1
MLYVAGLKKHKKTVNDLPDRDVVSWNRDMPASFLMKLLFIVEMW